MKPVKSIAFVGGTGKLAVPVVNLLVQNGFNVMAIVRSLERGRALLPSAVRLLEGDLNNPASIRAGLRGVDAVYINLATETDRLDLPFYDEREGVKTIVEAAKANNLAHIYKIGAGGAYPENIDHVGKPAVPNVIRLAGQRYIEQSGIPYTIFDPTMFMDNISHQIRGRAIQWIGHAPVQNWWISSDDYARQVLNAINNPRAQNRHYLMQGPELLTPQQVFARFIAAYDPAMRVQSFPLWLVRAMGVFNAQMRFGGYMISYFEQTMVEPFRAQTTWDDLGKPTVTIDEYARQLKAKSGQSTH
jgi:uncharacterized protein YbjT (DUF2867 family)